MSEHYTDNQMLTIYVYIHILNVVVTFVCIIHMYVCIHTFKATCPQLPCPTTQATDACIKVGQPCSGAQLAVERNACGSTIVP